MRRTPAGFFLEKRVAFVQIPLARAACEAAGVAIENWSGDLGTLYLVRHGRTRLNREKVFRGRLDVPLDEVGEAEGRAAAGALSGVRFDHVYASPLSRAQQTAAFLSEAVGMPVETEEAFCDIDYGLWTERRDEDIRRESSELHAQWLAEPGEVRFPDGEGLADVRGRVAGALGRIADGDGTVAIVSHRVTLKVILCVLLDLGDDYFRRFQLDTASYSRLDHDGAWCLTTLNICTHLASIEGHLEAEDF